MNRWGLMSALALAAALLLMGCRETEKQTDMAEEHPITYEDVYERNTISALLGDYCTGEHGQQQRRSGRQEH